MNEMLEKSYAFNLQQKGFQIQPSNKIKQSPVL